MLSAPRIGEFVRVRYRDRTMPLHDRTGVVRVSSRGRPRNHGIEIDSTFYVIPAGNLFAETSYAEGGSLRQRG